MTRNLAEPNPQRVQARTSYLGKDTRQKPGAFKWWEPDCDETDPDSMADGCTGLEPPLINDFAQPEPPLEKFAFRLHSDGSLEFKGHLDISAAASGDVAVVLPGAVEGEVDFRTPNDQFFLTAVWDGFTPVSALVYIDSTTGDVYVYWPIT